MYCCVLLFYKNYIVYYNAYGYDCGVFIEKCVYTKFCRCGASYIAIYAPIVMYCIAENFRGRKFSRFSRFQNPQRKFSPRNFVAGEIQFGGVAVLRACAVIY